MTTTRPPILHTDRWFSRLPDDFAQALVLMGHVKSLKTDECLFLRGSPPCGLYALLSGSVRISGQCGTAKDAREVVLAVLTPPAWFGEICVFDNDLRTHQAQAAEPSSFLHVPQAALHDWLEDHPQHWRCLSLLLTDKLRLIFKGMEEQTALSSAQRLTRRLELMFNQYRVKSDGTNARRVLNVTQQDLAHMTGITRQSVNIILTDLKEMGIIDISRGRIEILDLDRLKSFSN